MAAGAQGGATRDEPKGGDGEALEDGRTEDRQNLMNAQRPRRRRER